MFGIVVICAIVGLATVLIHHRGLLGIADLASRHAHVRPAVVIPGVVVGIFGLHLIEIGLFAGAIAFASYVLHLGRIVGDVDGTDLELLYFSAETFTTLGFGDIIPSGQMRLLASFEPLNGLILLGWSASFIHLEVERYWRRPEIAPARAPAAAVARTSNISPGGLQRGRHALRRRLMGVGGSLDAGKRRRAAAGR